MTTAFEPAWLRHARSLLSTLEVAGTANSPTILSWAKRLGTKVLGMAYNADSVPWCGLFVAQCLAAGGIDLAAAGMHRQRVAVRATAWSAWGSNLRLTHRAPGAILVFVRPGGGHVGFHVGEDATHFHVLGGNQGDKVSIVRIDKSRLVAARWPMGEPVAGRPVRMAASAIGVSQNEA
jgi:uncharacterized protein (TIGR02594 family)